MSKSLAYEVASRGITVNAGWRRANHTTGEMDRHR